MQQQPWMAAAWAEFGQSERTGPATNPQIIDYFGTVGRADVVDDETAWCAAYVGACLERAGYASTRSLMARSYLDWGVRIEAPAVGTVAVLTRGADTSLGHVGFVVGCTDEALFLLGGNQADAVNVARFDRGRLIGLRMPAAEVSAKPDQDNRFEAALAHVLQLEGGWSDDPFDPGGPTNKGITLGDFARYRRVSITAQNFAAMKAELQRIPDATVRDIYRTRYWQPATCANLPPPLALMHFDAAVNQGVAGSAAMLQEALAVDVDGEIGPITLRAARTRSLPDTLEDYADIRRRRYRSLSHFWRFGRGWLRRVDSTLAQALHLAVPSSSSPTLQPQEHPMPDPQNSVPATPESSADPKWWGHSMTIWGALLTALSTVLPLLGPALGLELTVDLVQRLGQDVVLVIQALGGLIGTVMTIMGRVRATAPIERRPVRLKL